MMNTLNAQKVQRGDNFQRVFDHRLPIPFLQPP